MNLRKDETMAIAYVLAAILCALLLVEPGTAAAEETVTISGEIEAADYDDDGEVNQVAVFDSEWGSVLVLKSGKGNELLSLVGVIVSATGELSELDDDSGYSYAIEVTSYTIDEPPDPEEDPGDNPEN
jgi:hypothetical protein